MVTILLKFKNVVIRTGINGSFSGGDLVTHLLHHKRGGTDEPKSSVEDRLGEV